MVWLSALFEKRLPCSRCYASKMAPKGANNTLWRTQNEGTRVEISRLSVESLTLPSFPEEKTTTLAHLEHEGNQKTRIAFPMCSCVFQETPEIFLNANRFYHTELF